MSDKVCLLLFVARCVASYCLDGHVVVAALLTRALPRAKLLLSSVCRFLTTTAGSPGNIYLVCSHRTDLHRKAFANESVPAATDATRYLIWPLLVPAATKLRWLPIPAATDSGDCPGSSPHLCVPLFSCIFVNDVRRRSLGSWVLPMSALTAVRARCLGKRSRRARWAHIHLYRKTSYRFKLVRIRFNFLRQCFWSM